MKDYKSCIVSLVQKEAYSDKVEVVVILAVICYIARTNLFPHLLPFLSKRKHLVAAKVMVIEETRIWELLFLDIHLQQLARLCRSPSRRKTIFLIVSPAYKVPIGSGV